MCVERLMVIRLLRLKKGELKTTPKLDVKLNEIEEERGNEKANEGMKEGMQVKIS